MACVENRCVSGRHTLCPNRVKDFKSGRKTMKINFYLDQFWQQEEGSADASHQMVGLCGYEYVLL